MNLNQLLVRNNANSLIGICALLIISACSLGKDIYLIKQNQTTEINPPGNSNYTASIRNKSMKQINVSVNDASTDRQIRSFGLGPKGQVDVTVEGSSILKLTKTQSNNSKVLVVFRPLTSEYATTETQTIQFTLRNNTAKSIPLIIPSVMNPNLSPFSNSGVNLKIGQEIFFKKGGKRYLLLTVDASIQNNDVLDVAQIISQRKKELDL